MTKLMVENNVFLIATDGGKRENYGSLEPKCMIFC